MKGRADKDKSKALNKLPEELKRQALKQAQTIALEQARRHCSAYFLPVDGEYGNPFIIAYPRSE